MGYEHAGSGCWASQSTRDSSSQVGSRLLRGSPGCWCSRGLCGVRDNVGTATPALALAAGSSKDHKSKINQERPQCWSSAVALQTEVGCGRGG